MTLVYISADSGDDVNGSGSINSPFKNLQRAIDKSRVGDTIFCKSSNNSYVLDDKMEALRNIRGEDSNHVIFDGGGKNVNWLIGSSTNNNINSIDNITFQNVVLENSKPMISILDNCHAMKFSNCIFHNIETFDAGETYTSGVVGNLGSSLNLNLDFSNSLFYDIRKNKASFDGYMFGMRINNSRDELVEITFTNCTIIKSVDGKSNITHMLAIRDNDPDQKSNLKVYINNTIIKNSTPTSFILYSYPFQEDSYVIRNSNLFNVGGVVEDDFNIYTDPQFMDEENNDFNLRPHSPCAYFGEKI